MRLIKILLFIKVPPPITGATLMNKRVHDSELLRKTFNIRSITISYMQHVSQMGKWTLFKVVVFIRLIIKLLNELWNHCPKFVYFQISPHGFAFLRDLIFVTLIKVFHVKILFHMRGKGIKYKSDLSKLFYKYCFRHEYVICLSSLLTYDVQDVFNGKLFVVPNGIPDTNPHFIRKSVTEPPKILFLSNLIKAKGVLDFVNALKILRKTAFEFEASIVGAEGDISKHELGKILEEYSLDSEVKYLGAKYGSEKTHILSHSDIFVFPTKYKTECFPGVILEAMQFGLPVVSTFEAAIPEIVDDGVTGFLVDKDAPEQIAEKIEILIKDPALRKRMGEAGRRKYEEKYTLQHFEENMKNVFQEVLDDISK
jgi:glycosyltransferase involved in cell wall biosynthesis